MKILHLTAVRRLSPGQRKQLTYEVLASREFRDCEWATLAFHTQEPIECFERQIPAIFRPIILRNLYVWLYMLKVSREYDFIINRHITFDPFNVLLGWFIRNRISVHHSKEIAELLLIRRGWKGSLASLTERITGSISALQVKGIIGVTEDIRDYQIERHPFISESMIYPNGIYGEHISPLDDKRATDINIAFICGKFSEWHGLDLLLDAFATQDISLFNGKKISIHLIGFLSAEQIEQVEYANRNNSIFIRHGIMSVEQYRPVLSKCNIGLDSLAISRKNLQEAASLKAREYLAMGLPVYSGSKDAAIPEEYKYYKVGPVDAAQIIDFSESMQHVSRSDVRDSSMEYISKAKLMNNVLQWLKSLGQ